MHESGASDAPVLGFPEKFDLALRYGEELVHGNDAIDVSDANEDVLGFDPLKGDWSISLPCEPDDLGWVQSALQQKSNRITAHEKTEAKKQDTADNSQGATLEIDLEGLLEP